LATAPLNCSAALTGCFAALRVGSLSSLALKDGVPFDVGDIMTVEEIAAALHVPREWIVRRARKLPFVRKLSRKKYACSRIRLRQWLASRPGWPNGA